MENIFRLCSANHDKYLCVKDFNEDAHEATLVSIHTTSSLNEVKRLAAEGYTILYSTPRGGYVPVSRFDEEFITGQVYILEDAIIRNPDRDVYYFAKERAHDYYKDNVIFIGAVTSVEDEEYAAGLAQKNALCSSRWTTPMSDLERNLLLGKYTR